MTTTCARVLRPSINVSSCDTIRRSTSPCGAHHQLKGWVISRKIMRPEGTNILGLEQVQTATGSHDRITGLIYINCVLHQHHPFAHERSTLQLS